MHFVETASLVHSGRGENIARCGYLLTRNRDLGTFSNRYRFDPSTGIEVLHPSGNVTATRDPENKTITVIDDGLGSVQKYFWRLEVELLP